MPVSEANKRAARKYIAANIKQINFSLSMKYDADIIAHLDAQKNKQGYLKSLIREDMARAKSGEAPAQNLEQAQPEAVTRAKVSTAPAQNIMMEDTTMEYKANSLSQSLPIDAQKDALPIRDQQEEEEKKMWYAVLINREDDWGTGSYNKEEAIRMAREQLAEYPDTLIAVIDNSTSNPVCVDEITDFDTYETPSDAPAQNPDATPTAREDDPGVPSGGNPWYAVLAASDDDWSKGSFNLDEAKAMAREIRKKHPCAMIAVIDNSLDFPFCSDTITDF